MDSDYHPYAHLKAIEDLMVTTMAVVIAQAPTAQRIMLQKVMQGGGIASTDQKPDKSDPMYAVAESALKIRAGILQRVSVQVDAFVSPKA